MMTRFEEQIAALRRELEEERAENARFRRIMEDLLYNLEEENMPTVSSRISASERGLSLLVEDGTVKGGVLIEAINGASAVTIDADRINLNGAVSANGNFEIKKDGSVACRALSLTGGEIILPDPGDGSAVLRVESEDSAAGVTVYADRIAFDGSFKPSWEQEGALDLEQLYFRSRLTDGTGQVLKHGGYFRPGEVILQEEVEGGDPEEGVYTACGIRLPYLYHHAKPDHGGMRPLYIDECGDVYAALA